MEYRTSFFAGIVLVLVNVFGASIGLENSSVESKSSEVIPVHLANCTSTSTASYQCVKIEDCRAKRRRGSRRFCKWNGKPTHVCCLEDRAENSMKPSQIRQKRDDSIYFEDDFAPSSKLRYQRKDFDPGHFHSRFNPTHDRFRDYDDEFELIDNEGWENSFHNNEPECGVLEAEVRGKNLAPVVGGWPVKTAESHPWMVAIGEKQANGKPRWFCGGTLISRKIVITAAHCITKSQANLVRVGDLDLTTDMDPAEPQDSEIESAIVHPRHKQPRHYHDIAIVRLKTPVRYTKYVRPICLPPNNGNLYENDEVTLTGWGSTRFGGGRSPILQEVRISVISNALCNKKYGDRSTMQSNIRTLPRGIIDSQMCAGDENGGRDACQGDSGGPIVKKEGRRRVVVGIVSSGLGCGSKMYPGIYTRVSYYSDWIRSFL